MILNNNIPSRVIVRLWHGDYRRAEISGGSFTMPFRCPRS